MKKLFFGGLIFISIFILNILPTVQPANGYEFNITSKDVGTTIEYEVKIFDQDEWRKHLGKSTTTDLFFHGNSNIIGAKSKNIIINFSSNENMYYLENYTFIDYVIESNSDARTNISSLVDPLIASPYGPLVYIMNLSIWYTVASLSGFPAAQTVATMAAESCNKTMDCIAQNIINTTEALTLYGKKYNGTIMAIDKWNFKEGQFNLSPDLEGEKIQFLANPLDWYDAFTRLMDFKLHQHTNLTTFNNSWYQLYLMYFNGASHPVFPYNLMTLDDRTAYEALNTTLFFIFSSVLGLVKAFSLYGVPNDLSAIGGLNYQHDFVMGTYAVVDVILTAIWQSLDAIYPDKFGHLFNSLTTGLPTYTPVNIYLEKAIEEFNIDDSALYKISGLEVGQDKNLDGKINPIANGTVSNLGVDLGGETIYIYAYVNINVEDRIVTMKIDYQDGQVDPADTSFFSGDENEILEDWEAIFTYRNNGILDTVVFKNSTTEFYMLEFLEVGFIIEQNGNGKSKAIEDSYELSIVIFSIVIIGIIALTYAIISKARKTQKQ